MKNKLFPIGLALALAFATSNALAARADSKAWSYALLVIEGNKAVINLGGQVVIRELRSSAPEEEANAKYQITARAMESSALN